MPIRIEIIPGNPPSVNQNTVRVSRGKNDRVEWHSTSNDWAVVFDGPTPFERYYYSPCNPGNTQLTGAQGSYKYTVFVNGQKTDPIIIVDP
ncbi:MAG TPA: hypothetical protein VFC10_07705 [Terriglobia bacterium]|jgi:hypothetical protein|nr:hypothetical protein [Terriglobia bacterium]